MVADLRGGEDAGGGEEARRRRSVRMLRRIASARFDLHLEIMQIHLLLHAILPPVPREK